MTDQEQVILSILKQFLGNPRKDYKGLMQFEFNCPASKCRQDHDKFNLTFNLNKKIFNCWKCHYSGTVHQLAEDYGTKDNKDRLNLIFPPSQFKNFSGNTDSSSFKNKTPHTEIICELPDGYLPLNKVYQSRYYTYAIKYLEKRRITKEMVEKYHIGYTESGPRKFRIIIPSFNQKNQINYYEARAYLSYVKPSYYKPKEPHKSEIIFNIKNINFDLPVYLIEGVFDMMPLYNAIPLLGKNISDLLLSYLIRYKPKIILCLDEDAITDSIELYKLLESYGLDVYFVEVPDDIAKFYELYGKEELIKLLKNFRKLNFSYIFELFLKIKEKNKNSKNRIDEDILEKEWKKIQKAFSKDINNKCQQ